MAMDMQTLLAVVATLFVLYVTRTAVTRIILHPLASVPGPKAAALTQAYELYYDLVAGGRLPWKIQELHKHYGPIIRIAPNEVHVSSPSYVRRHFFSSANKYEPHQYRFGFPEATSETVDAGLHRMRYNALAPVFSRRAVNQLEPVIVEKIERACKRLAQYSRPSEESQPSRAVNLRHLFLCMTTDTLTAYAFPVCFNLLDEPNLCPQWYEMMNLGLRKMQYFKHFPVLWDVMRSPAISGLVGRLVPGFAMVQKVEMQNKKIVREVIGFYEQNENETTKTETSTNPDLGPRAGTSTPNNTTVFHRLLSSDLPKHEKSFERLWQEGSSLMGAGTETVANLLTFILVHLHSDPLSLGKLKIEVEEAIPDSSILPPWNELETLPYLSAVISEGLRMGLSVVDRILRVLPDDTTVEGFFLPKGTLVSMSSIVLHFDEYVWTEPDRWNPDRFLGSDAASRKNLISFSKGPRACAGMNLAYAQLYLTLAAVIRRFDLCLYETSTFDVEPYYDGIVALTREQSNGVHVQVLGSNGMKAENPPLRV